MNLYMKHKWKLRRRGSWEHHLKLLGSEHQNKLKLIILFERTILVKNLTHQLSKFTEKCSYHHLCKNIFFIFSKIWKINEQHYKKFWFKSKIIKLQMRGMGMIKVNKTIKKHGPLNSLYIYFIFFKKSIKYTGANGHPVLLPTG